jgi:hypothetical protein
MRIFLFGFIPEQVHAINDILRKLVFPPAETIPADSGGTTVQSVLDGTPAAGVALESAERLILLHDFRNSDLNRFLDAYAVSALPQPLWAAVTDVNRRWTLRELLLALQAERRKIMEQGFGPGETGAEL